MEALQEAQQFKAPTLRKSTRERIEEAEKERQRAEQVRSAPAHSLNRASMHAPQCWHCQLDHARALPARWDCASLVARCCHVVEDHRHPLMPRELGPSHMAVSLNECSMLAHLSLVLQCVLCEVIF